MRETEKHALVERERDGRLIYFTKQSSDSFLIWLVVFEVDMNYDKLSRTYCIASPQSD